MHLHVSWLFRNKGTDDTLREPDGKDVNNDEDETGDEQLVPDKTYTICADNAYCLLLCVWHPVHYKSGMFPNPVIINNKWTISHNNVNCGNQGALKLADISNYS